MAGQTASPRGRVSLLGVIVGGLLIGAGGFGLFRVTSANPGGDGLSLPPLPPVSEPRPDAVGLPVLPAGGPIPVVVPPLGDLPKSGDVPLPPPPAALPAPTLPAMPPVGDLPKPGGLPPVGDLPKLGDLPKPGGFDPPALPLVKPTVPEVGPAPKPVQPTELAPLPAGVPPLPPMPPTNPDFNLRPSAPGNTVNPKPSPAELPQPAVSVLPAPVGPLDPPMTPGDPPVPLTLRQTMLSAALGVGFALSPSPVLHAQDPAKEKDKDKEKDPKPVEVDVKKQIEDLKKEIAALRKQHEVNDDFIHGRKDPILPADHGLLKRVQTLEEAIKRIEAKLDAGTRQAVGSSPIREAAVAGTGTIRLINEYPTDVRIVVNGVSHELKPNELKELAVPAGEFVYELLAAAAAKTTSTIKDGERVTLRIR